MHTPFVSSSLRQGLQALAGNASFSEQPEWVSEGLSALNTIPTYAELESIASVEGFNSFLDKRRIHGESFGYIHWEMRFRYMGMLTQSGWISEQIFVAFVGNLHYIKR